MQIAVDKQQEILERIEAEMRIANELSREGVELQKRAIEMQGKMSAEMEAHLTRAREINDGAAILQKKSIEVTERARTIQKVALPVLLLLVVYISYLLFFKVNL